MLIKMHHKIIDNALAAILGVFGYGITITNLSIQGGDVVKFSIAMLSAFCAGFVGYIGKRAGSWALRKIRAFINLKHKP